MKPTRTMLALFVAAFVLPMTAVGQDEEASGENVVAASQKSAGELRRDLWKAEKDFFAMYNKLNDDNLYDVRCSKEVPTGSVIKTQTCRPKFLSRALKDGKIKKDADLQSDPEVANNIATFRKNMDSLIATNPELRSAAIALNEAQARLVADKERRANN